MKKLCVTSVCYLCVLLSVLMTTLIAYRFLRLVPTRTRTIPFFPCQICIAQKTGCAELQIITQPSALMVSYIAMVECFHDVVRYVRYVARKTDVV